MLWSEQLTNQEMGNTTLFPDNLTTVRVPTQEATTTFCAFRL